MFDQNENTLLPSPAVRSLSDDDDGGCRRRCCVEVYVFCLASERRHGVLCVLYCNEVVGRIELIKLSCLFWRKWVAWKQQEMCMQFGLHVMWLDLVFRFELKIV